MTAALSLLILTGCAGSVSGPPPKNAQRFQGVLETACSPVDAVGIGIELHPSGGADRPRVSVALWPDRGLAAGQRYRIEPGQGGYAAAFVSGTEWVPAVSGELALESFAEGESASGWFRLVLSDGSSLSGWFETDWSDRGPVYCG